MLPETVPLKNHMAIQCGRSVMQFSRAPSLNPDNIKFDWEQD